VCEGDEYNKCNTCKVRFLCHTGELPTEFSKGNNIFYSRNIEFNIFGEINSLKEGER
jgi:hypothetical protein